ncbi:MAG: hypothetical protein H2046_05360, partial [Rhizobiales bacterium]|nr:hypothetical protein [Hyphomicrobiales bacterium]
PYVVAADVYGTGALEGRGGWTWYTGSAGWLYRAAVEGILGIRREGDRLLVQPVLPSEWDGFSAELTIAGVVYRIVVEKSETGEALVSVNGDGIDLEVGAPLNTATAKMT